MSTSPAAVRLARLTVLPTGSRELVAYVVAVPVGADPDAIAAAVDPDDRVVRIDWLNAAEGVTAITRTNERGTMVLV